jgi:hypothetical protein
VAVTGSQRIISPDALADAAHLRARVAVLRARRTEPAPARTAAVEGVLDLLGRAERAARGIEPRHRLISGWWTGRSLELAYQYLHAARVELVEVYDEREIDAAIPLATSLARRALDRDDPRLDHIERIATLPTAGARRAAVRDALQAGYASMRRWHRQRRRFRNAVYLAAIGMAVLVAAVVAVGVWHPQYIPFCFHNVTALQPDTMPAAGDTVAAARVTNCPSGSAGSRLPQSHDVMIVALLGLIGGSLAAAVSIRGMTGTASPYRLAGALATLKVPTGAMAAIAGLIAIRGNFVPGLSALDSQEQILAYALVLGYAQQLATGFLDRRARTLDKDEPADPTTPAPPPIGPAAPPVATAPERPPAAGAGEVGTRRGRRLGLRRRS